MDHIGLVCSIAKKLHRVCPYLDINDLIQSGIVGMLRAREKFDSSKNAAFATYATPWITTFIRREINSSDFVRLPIHLYETAYKEKGDEARSRVGKDKISSLSLSFSDPEDRNPTPDIEIEQKETLKKVKEVFSRLDEQSKTLIVARMEGKTNAEVGKTLNKSHEIARQRTQKAFLKFRQAIVKAGLSPYEEN